MMFVASHSDLYTKSVLRRFRSGGLGLGLEYKCKEWIHHKFIHIFIYVMYYSTAVSLLSIASTSARGELKIH